MATYEIIRETHGEATCLATTLGGQRWWITRTAEFSFTVETCLEAQYGDIEVVAVKTCRSLAAAQKWLEQHWRDWVPDERCKSYHGREHCEDCRSEARGLCEAVSQPVPSFPAVAGVERLHHHVRYCAFQRCR